MNEFFHFLSIVASNKLFQTLLLISLMQFTSHQIVRLIRKDQNFLDEKHRTWISRTKNIKVLIIMLVLISIWWIELEKYALSFAAVAVAIVIASKELILCFSGSIIRASANAFSIGDWIKVGDNVGEVIEQNVLSTIVQEIDVANNTYNYTGRTLTIPNSQFLIDTIQNMNFMKRYVYHTFTINCDGSWNVYEVRDHIFEKMEAYSKEFFEVGRRYNKVIEKSLGVDLPGEEPYIRITTTESGGFNFTIILFCPTEQAVSLEQRITQDFMEFKFANNKS